MVDWLVKISQTLNKSINQSVSQYYQTSTLCLLNWVFIGTLQGGEDDQGIYMELNNKWNEYLSRTRVRHFDN